MARIWFAAKKYGYGWYPATWEGWLVIAVFLALILLPPFLNQRYAFIAQDQFFFLYLPYSCILCLLLVWISARKGEPTRWRWGN